MPDGVEVRVAEAGDDEAPSMFLDVTGGIPKVCGAAHVGDAAVGDEDGVGRLGGGSENATGGDQKPGVHCSRHRLPEATGPPIPADD